MEHAPGSLPEWEESDLTFPFTLKAAFGKEKYVFNGLGDGGVLTNFKDSEHRQSCGDALIDILLHRRYIMCEQNAAFRRGPFEHFRIPFAQQSGILNTHDVQITSAAQQPTQDTIIEVFVSR
ncbi:MAG TPA: hypothetical protein VF240_05615 [Pyrinomonadaceae bacterium]